ncbi:MAG: hypothetical protein RIA62_17575 [Cyclobacteriaceae bacterium]
MEVTIHKALANMNPGKSNYLSEPDSLSDQYMNWDILDISRYLHLVIREINYVNKGQEVVKGGWLQFLERAMGFSLGN